MLLERWLVRCCLFSILHFASGGAVFASLKSEGGRPPRGVESRPQNFKVDPSREIPVFVFIAVANFLCPFLFLSGFLVTCFSTTNGVQNFWVPTVLVVAC